MTRLSRLAGMAGALLGASALAQSPPAPQGAPAPTLFEGYRAFADEPVVSWKEANDNVGRIGGWRAYAREAQGGGHAHGASAPAASPAAPPSAAPGAGADPHAGHH